MASRTRYVTFYASAMLAMLMGSQWVHRMYRPLDDIEDLVEEKLKERRKELQKKQLS